MIQKTYEVLMENTQNLLEGRVRLQAIVQKIREEPLYETASSIYIKAILANVTEEQAGNITGFLRECPSPCSPRRTRTRLSCA